MPFQHGLTNSILNQLKLLSLCYVLATCHPSMYQYQSTMPKYAKGFGTSILALRSMTWKDPVDVISTREARKIGFLQCYRKCLPLIDRAAAAIQVDDMTYD